MTSTNAEAFP